jgi:hypothetical protein
MKSGVFQSGSQRNIIITQAGIDHMAAHPIEDHLLHEAFRMLVVPYVDTKFWKGTVDLGRIIGHSGCVAAPAVGLDEQATFAHRVNRKRATRCTIAEPQETSLVTVVLRRGKYSDYFFVSAWCGDSAPAEPNHVNDAENLDFWCKNALIWNDQSFIEEPFESTWREVLMKKKKVANEVE